MTTRQQYIWEPMAKAVLGTGCAMWVPFFGWVLIPFILGTGVVLSFRRWRSTPVVE